MKVLFELLPFFQLRTFSMHPYQHGVRFAIHVAIACVVIGTGWTQAQDLVRPAEAPQNETPAYAIPQGTPLAAQPDAAWPSPPVPVEIPYPEELAEGVEIPETINPSELKTIDGFSGGFCTEEFCIPNSRRYTSYRQRENLWSYLPGDGDQFGWIDFEDTPYIDRKETSGWSIGTGLHLLSGPNAVPLPPRLWDFILGYQMRNTISDRFSYDLAATLGVYSDFEDSARDGIRFPAHAVGILHMNDAWDWVGGVDYLDRDDYKILPVAGFSWHSPDFPNWTMDLVFPRPRVDFALSSKERVYIGGFLGGGTWDIEMPGDVNDVMTYRDFRLIFGLEQLHDKGRLSGLELGYVFGRQVDFRTLQPGVEFDDGFLIRWVSRH